MENTPNGNEYNLLEEIELIADNRLKERDSFIEATSYQVARALIDKEVTPEQANHVMEQVGEKYPLSLEEMAKMINKVHTANNLGCIEDPKEKEIPPTDAKAWAMLLARLNPKYEIFTDKDGDISLGLTKNE